MNLEETQNLVRAALEPEYRGKLLARGQARAMIWRDGELPPNPPDFSPHLSYDLLSYGCSLLSLGIRLREGECDDQELICDAFQRAGEAIESVVSKGNPADPQRGFYRMLTASAFHLAGLSAQAFSLLNGLVKDSNLSPMERALARLILRDLDGLEKELINRRVVDLPADEIILNQLKQVFELEDTPNPATVDDTISEALDIALSDQFYGVLGAFLLALQNGDVGLVDTARGEIQKGLDASAEFNLVPQWWCFRLTLHLLDDLWGATFHAVLPEALPEGDNVTWQKLRRLFIASLFCRDRAEVDLWPSQTKAAKRSVDKTDNLVVSLPTSAGKTRIAELCILRCLADNKRVIFVTPLRALSAQTEVTLRKTFAPLGKTVSALYGSVGASSFDTDALKSRDIVVATPEKLDFAIRNDADILDNVGLVVLDEGHMIGLNEREIRYEVQIQKLLKRPDAAERRIVCLSAVLPEGEQFNDFVQWLRRDEPGDSISSDWRPTRLRFGEVLWQNNRARLNLHVGGEDSFVPNFFGQRRATQGRRTALFPRDQGELVLGTAWQLFEDERSVLIYCPERISVDSLAKKIVDLTKKGFLKSALKAKSADLATALAIGKEWLGEDHPVLKCLSRGVAVHHGDLPRPFRKEIEDLLRKNILKITISSPTLAQGLNLTVTAIVMYSLKKYPGRIPPTEFQNVVGRAGRAFVDVEGLVLFPIFDKDERDEKLEEWFNLIDGDNKYKLRSGFFRLVYTLLFRLNKSLGNPGTDQLQEYVLNNTTAWAFPIVSGESNTRQKINKENWEKHITYLDTAILGLIGDELTTTEQIAAKLDKVLQSSLWQKSLQRRSENVQDLIKTTLEARAQLIWAQTTSAQRRGYFLAGVGLQTGQLLDVVAGDANHLLVTANNAILHDEQEIAIAAITSLAEILFQIKPFIPKSLPDNWRNILRLWLLGQPLVLAEGKPPEILRFIEGGLIYSLSWAIGAVKVRAQANRDIIGDDGFTIDDFETGLAVPAIETGTLNRSAAILMQAGFTFRSAAIQIVNDTAATFENFNQMNAWLESDNIKILSEDRAWPSIESHDAWVAFTQSYVASEDNIWDIQEKSLHAEWFDTENPPPPNTSVKLINLGDETFILSATLVKIGRLKQPIPAVSKGVLTAKVARDRQSVVATYSGSENLW